MDTQTQDRPAVTAMATIVANLTNATAFSVSVGSTVSVTVSFSR